MATDIAIIGSGPGGYVAAIRAAQLGHQVVCIEKENTLGGTCLNVGCIPSKALLYTTEQYNFCKNHALIHGIEFNDLRIDPRRMNDRKNKVVESLVEGVANLFKTHKIRTIQGKARLISSTEIEVKSGEKISHVSAKNIILATGSIPIEFPGLPFDEKIVLSSTGALNIEKIPKTIAVIGGGVIGVEMASVYQRFGSQVIVIEMLDQICPGVDKSISKTLLHILLKQGIQFFLTTKVKTITVEKRKVHIEFEQEGKISRLDTEKVLICVGRKPYSVGLGLEEIGIKISPKGYVQVDSRFRTSIPNILAIGDLIEGPMLAHRASEEGYTVAELLSGKSAEVHYMEIPNVIYTSPEVAVVGLSEIEAREANIEIQVGTSSFKGNPRARCVGESDGVVKIISDRKSKKVVGVQILGPAASELIAEGMLAIRTGALVEDLAHSPNAHPTYSEAIKEAALAIVNVY